MAITNVMALVQSGGTFVNIGLVNLETSNAVHATTVGNGIWSVEFIDGTSVILDAGDSFGDFTWIECPEYTKTLQYTGATRLQYTGDPVLLNAEAGNSTIVVSTVPSGTGINGLDPVTGADLGATPAHRIRLVNGYRFYTNAAGLAEIVAVPA